MRTPKIEAHHRLIDWFNLRLKGKEAIPKLGLDNPSGVTRGTDNSSLGDNAWLSGFIEADGNFHFDIPIDGRGFGVNIHYYLRISQRREYHREADECFYEAFTRGADYLRVSKVTNIERKHNNYVELGYEVRALRVESRKLVIDYITNFPLFSSKYQDECFYEAFTRGADYLAWLEWHTMYKAKKHLSVNGAQEMLKIKNSMNNSRTQFNWDSLDNFYTF